MYIHNLQSGGDYTNSMYSNYGGDRDELLRLHNDISRMEKEVLDYKKKKLEIEKAFQDLAPFLSSHSKEYGRLISIKQRGVITNPNELADLERQIAVARKGKDEARLKYSQLNGEMSQTMTGLQSREMGMIPANKQRFETISGKPYVSTFSEADVPLPIDVTNTTIENELDNLNNETIVGHELPIFDGAPRKGKETIIDKISRTVGTSRQNTKYGLIGLGVVSIFMILKNK